MLLRITRWIVFVLIRLQSYDRRTVVSKFCSLKIISRVALSSYSTYWNEIASRTSEIFPVLFRDSMQVGYNTNSWGIAREFNICERLPHQFVTFLLCSVSAKRIIVWWRMLFSLARVLYVKRVICWRQQKLQISRQERIYFCILAGDPCKNCA